MGFVEETMASFSPVGGNEVYEPLSLKDWMWTWILQSGINDTDPSWALHGKTMYLMEAGRHEEALEAQMIAFRRLTGGPTEVV